MTTHTANNNRTSQWNITADNDTWIVGKNATFTVTNGNGIAENSFAGSTIKIFGDMVIKGNGYAGAHINGSNSSVLIGANAVINASQASYGVFSEAAGADIVNHGRIRANDTGLGGAIWSDVVNDGTITANAGILFEGGGSQVHNSGKIDAFEYGVALGAGSTLLVNEKQGEIVAEQTGVFFEGMGSSLFVNKGILRSDHAAIKSNSDALSVTNTGKIFGNVLLGAGEDVFDTRHGTIQGVVHGGVDNDTYRIASSGIKIVEGAAGGALDRVFTTESYTLKGEIEQLTLVGGKDINATGSGTDNQLYGNKGDNILSGKGGIDWLEGRGGTDILIGGGNADTFAFEKGYGKDSVRDFTNGVDHFHSGEVTSQSEFDGLAINQVGENTVINFGNGDRLVIEDTLKANIDYFDFV